MTTTYEDVHTAFLAHRRKHGKAKTAAVIAKFGNADLDEIPESKWQDIIAALKADGVELFANGEEKPKTLADIADKIYDRGAQPAPPKNDEELFERAYAKFNSAGRKRGRS